MDIMNEMLKKANEERLAMLLNMKKKISKDASFREDLMETQEQWQVSLRVLDAIDEAIAVEARYVGGERE